MNQISPFVLNGCRYSQDTFQGRFFHFLDVIDPRTLLTTPTQLAKAQRLLEQYKKGTLPSDVTHEELWRAQKVTQAILHPDTGHKIFMPFRMSGYVPFGSPIVLALLLPNPTLGQTIFWQTLNQSHNACVNYSNRNATKQTPISRFISGYIAAVSSAVSIAVGLTLLIRKADRFSPAAKTVIQRFVPLPSVAIASTCNSLFMRMHEVWEGIEVFDEKGEAVGTSYIAAKKAVRDTAITRAFLPTPIFLVPAVVMTWLERTKFLRRNPRLHLPINAVVCTVSFAVALPVSLALFPQKSEIETSKLEPEIQNSTQEKLLYYNKGL